ncbi:MAG: hypothetical protein ACLVJ6_12665 [Merdibacter sp.]
MTGTKGNAITVYNTEDTDAWRRWCRLQGRTDLCGWKSQRQGDHAQRQRYDGTVSSEDENTLITAGAMTKVSVSSEAHRRSSIKQDRLLWKCGGCAESKRQQCSFECEHLCHQGQCDRTGSAGEQNVRLTTAKGVELQIHVEDMIVETLNADGSKTYELVEASQLKAQALRSIRSDIGTRWGDDHAERCGSAR